MYQLDNALIPIFRFEVLYKKFRMLINTTDAINSQNNTMYEPDPVIYNWTPPLYMKTFC